MKPTRIAVALSLLAVLSACDKGAATHSHGDSEIRTEPGVWPPVLAGMENEQALQATALGAAQASVVDAMRGSIMNNPQVQQALGSNFREFDASLGDPKGNESASFLFYNYSNNTTVEALFAPSGQVQVQSQAASQFQPAEHAEEVPLAIELGRGALVSDGYSLANLTGTAMLAFPPSNQLPDNDNTFYPTRVMYVTFGPGDGLLPEYSALVNLSDNSVVATQKIN